MIYKTSYISPIGEIVLVSDGKNLTGLFLEGQGADDEAFVESTCDRQELPILIKTKKWLDRYFANEKPLIRELSLAPEGSNFRQGVWDILCDIPYGTVITYGDIAGMMARKMNKPIMAAQAVGGAVGHNPISIIIPCHRVIGAGGNLTGFGGGINLKVKLLKHEGVDMTNFYIPKKGTAL